VIAVRALEHAGFELELAGAQAESVEVHLGAPVPVA
jgi:hypothetical protein